MLATFTDYQRITGDTTSLEAEVVAMLADAQREVEEKLHRVIIDDTGTRRSGLEDDGEPVTEHLRTWPQDRGRVYPCRPPVASVVSPAAATIDFSRRAIEGVTASVASFVGPDIVTESGYLSPYSYMAFVTYRGGFTADTVPVKLKRGICRLGNVMLNPVPVVPVGVTSVRVGDTSVTYQHPQDPETAIAALLKDLRGFRYDPVWP